MNEKTVARWSRVHRGRDLGGPVGQPHGRLQEDLDALLHGRSGEVGER